MLPRELKIGFNGAASVSFFLGFLRDFIKMLRIAADFLLARSYILHFFPGPKDDGCLPRRGDRDRPNYQNKESNSHETWQGICPCGPVKLSRPKNERPGGPALRQPWCFFVRSSLK